jgi:hypothetical protein
VLVKAGDVVALRSPTEILATLDDTGSLEGMPFMPEMLQFFGRTFTVRARVERACDTVAYTGVRRVPDTVTLDDLRCDGGTHAGCGAQCLLYWKEAWLRPASPGDDLPPPSDDAAFGRLAHRVTARVYRAESTPAEPRFRCQATELIAASEEVGWFRVGRELTRGNVGVWKFVRVTVRLVLDEVGKRLGVFSYAPFNPEDLAGQRSFVDPEPMELRPGDLVRIRSKREIGATLNSDGRHRGLWFDREMLPYCGDTVRVKAKVERFIDEGTGRLVEFSSDGYILENVYCRAEQSENRWFCPRAIHSWWRGCWLERVDRPA